MSSEENLSGGREGGFSFTIHCSNSNGCEGGRMCGEGSTYLHINEHTYHKISCSRAFRYVRKTSQRHLVCVCVCVRERERERERELEERVYMCDVNKHTSNKETPRLHTSE